MIRSPSEAAFAVLGRLRAYAEGYAGSCDPDDVALVLNWLDEACDCRRFEQARDAAEPHGPAKSMAPGGALDRTLAAEERR